MIKRDRTMILHSRQPATKQNADANLEEKTIKEQKAAPPAPAAETSESSQTGKKVAMGAGIFAASSAAMAAMVNGTLTSDEELDQAFIDEYGAKQGIDGQERVTVSKSDFVPKEDSANQPDEPAPEPTPVAPPAAGPLPSAPVVPPPAPANDDLAMNDADDEPPYELLGVEKGVNTAEEQLTDEDLFAMADSENTEFEILAVEPAASYAAAEDDNLPEQGIDNEEMAFHAAEAEVLEQLHAEQMMNDDDLMADDDLAAINHDELM